ncbi:MAG: twin-arginine translocase TatA/TatE family subunit [Dehalococcoidia bacterium]|nr:twin-arginine translocase TatA/TatE family subunit [Dehalococcoidia bacterium]
MNLLGIGPLELVLIVAIALIVLGPNKLMTSARSMGKLFSEAKSKVEEAKTAIEETENESSEKPAKTEKAQLPSSSTTNSESPKNLTH